MKLSGQNRYIRMDQVRTQTNRFYNMKTLFRNTLFPIRAGMMLQPHIPEISPQSLIAALRNYGNSTEPKKCSAQRLLTRAEAAKLLSVTPLTISRYIKSGKLRKICLSPRSVRVDPESVNALLQCQG